MRSGQNRAMSPQPVLHELDARGVATVTLTRPEVNNAYDESLIQGLHDAMDVLKGARVVVLRGNGKHFQAGADLKWIARVAAQSVEENERISRATAMAVHRLNTLPVGSRLVVRALPSAADSSSASLGRQLDSALGKLTRPSRSEQTAGQNASAPAGR